MQRFAFYGRVSTEDNQDPAASRAWQLRRATELVALTGTIVREFFDVGVSRSLPWQRRPRAAELLQTIREGRADWTAIVIGEPHRAFYSNQFSLTFPLLCHYGIALWVPEVGGRVDPDSEAHDLMMAMFGG
ncbi:MAG: recombinase family protein, partial [Acidimicrobiales bacterium]